MLIPVSDSNACCELHSATCTLKATSCKICTSQCSFYCTLSEPGLGLVIYLDYTGSCNASGRVVKLWSAFCGNVQGCLCLASSVFVSFLVLCGIWSIGISYTYWFGSFLLGCFVGGSHGCGVVNFYWGCGLQVVRINEIYLDGYGLLCVDICGSNFWFGCWTHDIFEGFCDDVYGSVTFVVCGGKGVVWEEEASSNMDFFGVLRDTIHIFGCGVSFCSCGSVSLHLGGLLNNWVGVLLLPFSSLWFLIAQIRGLLAWQASYFLLLLLSTELWQWPIRRGWCLMVGVSFWCLWGRCIVFLRHRWGLCNLMSSLLVLGRVVVEICGVPGLYSLDYILWGVDPNNSNIFPILGIFSRPIHSGEFFFL